jgi:hypothetical protein
MQFPPGFRLEPLDWHLPSDIVHRDALRSGEDVIRPIGTLDVEFVSNELVLQAKNKTGGLAGHYPCGLKCPGCFSEDQTYSDAAQLMTWQEVFAVIDEARRIGLKSLKFLGPGELFQNPDLFDILDAAEERQLPLSIFTKGAELGDDNLARQVYGKFGINTAVELVGRIARYSSVRVLLGFNSFNPIRQDLMIGSFGASDDYKIYNHAFVRRGVANYTAKRNRALVSLCDAGFNNPVHGQRLSLIAAPVGLDQIGEIPIMYVWAARRNIPLVIAPTMESGPKALGLMKHDKKRDPHHEKIKRLFSAVYSKAIDEGILSLEQIARDGISAYMATAPCNQVANGLFLRANGQIQMCPGSSDPDAIVGNVHRTPITQIWKNSKNYKLGPLNNNWCHAKKNGLPNKLQRQIDIHLRQKYERMIPIQNAVSHVMDSNSDVPAYPTLAIRP